MIRISKAILEKHPDWRDKFWQFVRFGVVFTFRSRPSSHNAIGFGFSHLINYLLEIGLLNLFLWIGAGELLAPILVMIIVVPINFLILHFVYIYKGRK